MKTTSLALRERDNSIYRPRISKKRIENIKNKTLIDSFMIETRDELDFNLYLLLLISLSVIRQ